MNQTDPAGAAAATRAPVLDCVRAFVARTFYIPDDSLLENEASLVDKGVIDSTGVLELVAFVEQEFGIVPTDDEIVPENFDGIGRLARFIEGRLPR